MTGFGWDGLDNLTSVTPPGRPQHNLSYTGVNLLETYTPPVLMSVPNPETTYEYDDDRKLKTVTRPDGLIIGYTYDTAGRLATTTTAVGTTGAGTITYGYTGSHVTHLASSIDEVTVDDSYRGPLLTRQQWSGNVSGFVSTDYDADFNPATEKVNNGNVVNFAYDDDGLLTCASPASCDSFPTSRLSLARDPDNGLIDGMTMNTLSTTLTYNEFGELKSEATPSLLAETYHTTSAPRDPLGRITLKTEVIQGTSTAFGYSYDNRGRLETVTQGGTQTAHYHYDDNGNRLSVTTPSGTTSGTYDDQDRLLTYGTFTYAYTANGELHTKTNSANGDMTTYTYDVLGNLKRVDLPGGNYVEYLVDGKNRRVTKKRTVPSSSAGCTMISCIPSPSWTAAGTWSAASSTPPAETPRTT